MNLSNLKKEQKQYAVLGVLVGAIALFSLFTFVLMPLKNQWASARTDSHDLESKLEDARRLVRGEDTLKENLAALEAEMARASQDHLPDLTNPLAWATRTLYSVARETGLDVISISEVPSASMLDQLVDAEKRKFGAYAVRIESNCGYDDLRSFLSALGASNPYLCISSITIGARRGDPERHEAEVTVEWPAWIDAAAAQPYLNPEGGGRG